MLSQSHRFHGHGSLRYVYKNGTAIRSHLITLKYIRNTHRKHSRVAVVVSKKVLKTAVGRNRIRRRVYEVVRSQLPSIEVPHDIVILVFSSELISLPDVELQTLMRQLFEQANLFKKREESK